MARRKSSENPTTFKILRIDVGRPVLASLKIHTILDLNDSKSGLGTAPRKGQEKGRETGLVTVQGIGAGRGLALQNATATDGKSARRKEIAQSDRQTHLVTSRVLPRLRVLLLAPLQRNFVRNLAKAVVAALLIVAYGAPSTLCRVEMGVRD